MRYLILHQHAPKTSPSFGWQRTYHRRSSHTRKEAGVYAATNSKPILRSRYLRLGHLSMLTWKNAMRPTKSESLLLQGQVTQTSALTADQPQPRRVTPEPQKKLQCNQPA